MKIERIEILQHLLPLEPPFPAAWDPVPRTRLGLTSVRIHTDNDAGQEIILDTLYWGDFFGEMALVDNEPHSAMEIVGEDTFCTEFSKDEFDEILSNSNLLAAAHIRPLTRRIRESTFRREDD